MENLIEMLEKMKIIVRKRKEGLEIIESVRINLERQKEERKRRHKEHRKQYYKENKEKFKERHKEYREKNKEQLKERRKERVCCSICGKQMSRHSLSRHKKFH